MSFEKEQIYMNLVEAARAYAAECYPEIPEAPKHLVDTIRLWVYKSPSVKAVPNIRCFQVGCAGVISFVFHTSSSKAKFAAVSSAREAGFAVDFKSVRAHRMPQYDYLDKLSPSRILVGRPVNPDFLQTLINEHPR